MELWLGAAQNSAVAALQFKISSNMCGKFRPQEGHLLPSWQMDPSLPGVIQTMVATALQFKINSKMCSECRVHMVFWRCICRNLGRWIRRCLRQSNMGWQQLCSSTSAQTCAASSGHRRGICCHPGRWIRGYLGWSRLWWQQLFNSAAATIVALSCLLSSHVMLADWPMGTAWNFQKGRLAGEEFLAWPTKPTNTDPSPNAGSKSPPKMGGFSLKLPDLARYCGVCWSFWGSWALSGTGVGSFWIFINQPLDDLASAYLT